MGIQYKVDLGIMGNWKAAPIINIIEQVMGLDGVTFEWKKNTFTCPSEAILAHMGYNESVSILSIIVGKPFNSKNHPTHSDSVLSMVQQAMSFPLEAKEDNTLWNCYICSISVEIIW